MAAASPARAISAGWLRPIWSGSTSRWMRRWPLVRFMPWPRVPTASTTSAASMSGWTRRLTQAVPTESGLRSSMAPLPSRVVTTGDCNSSTTARNPSVAPPSTTPPPAMTTGLFDAASRSAAWSTTSGSAATGATSRPPEQRDLLALDEGLGWDLDLGRAGAAARHFEEGPPHRGGDGVGLEHALGPLGDGADQVELVVDVVEQAEVLADAVPVDLAGQKEHRGGAGIGGGQAGGRVVDPDTGDDHGHPGASRGAGVAVGHVGGALLVAGHDVADLGRVDQGVEGRHELVAGEPEDHLDPLVDQLAGQGLAPGHGGGFARGLCGGVAHGLVHHSRRAAATSIAKRSQCTGGPPPPKVGDGHRLGGLTARREGRTPQCCRDGG